MSSAGEGKREASSRSQVNKKSKSQGKKKSRTTGTKNGNALGVLTRLDIDILFHIAMKNNTNKQLHAKLKKRKGKRVPRTTISRHTGKLTQLGLIKAQKLYNLKEFYLTDHGKLAITEIMSRGKALSMDLPVRGHAFSLVCEITREPRDLRKRLKKENWIAYYPKNRVAYKQRLMGCMVVFNPRSVQFVPPEMYSPSSHGAFAQALRLVLKVKDFLENEEFKGLVLGSPQKVARITGQHYARLLDPLAIEYFKNSMKTGVRTTYRSDRIAIEQSLGLPETETVHKAHSKDDLAKITEFYERLIRSELTFDDLEFIRHELPSYFKKLIESMGALPRKMDRTLKPIATSFKESMDEHMKIIGVFRDESIERSEENKKIYDAIMFREDQRDQLIVSIVESLRKPKRKRRKRKPKPLSRWQKVRKRLPF